MQLLKIFISAMICLCAVMGLMEYIQGQSRVENVLQQATIALMAIAQTVIPTIFFVGLYFFLKSLFQKD